MPGAKPGDPQQTVQIQVVNPQHTPVSQASPPSSPKYQISQIPIQAFSQGATVLTVAYNSNQEGIQIVSLFFIFLHYFNKKKTLRKILNVLEKKKRNVFSL